MLDLILLSITQGITEFLPISSSAHLILISNYLSFNNNENLTIDISLHLGSLLAVIYFFKIKISNFFRNKHLFIKIIIGSLPTIIIGVILVKLNLIEKLRNIYTISLTTIFFGLILYFSDKTKQVKNDINKFNFREAVYIGLLQSLALIPGVSRSGITITGARFLNFDRVEAANISFLFSIPALMSAGAYGILKTIEINSLQITFQNFWSFLLSFIFSFITLKFFIKFLKKFSLVLFVIYRIILGLLILIYA